MRVLLDIATIASAARGIQSKVVKLRATGVREEAALRQAMRGGHWRGGRGAAVGCRAAPDHVVHDAGAVSRIVAEIADVRRVVALIRYAGDYGSPLNKLLDAGLGFRGRASARSCCARAIGTRSSGSS